MKKIACIILAAGRGVRMKSSTPKVLHRICGRPMLSFVIDTARALKIKKITVVAGDKQAEVKKLLKGESGVKCVVQKRLLGTADALKVALRTLGGSSGTILVLYGDIPLLKVKTLKGLLAGHAQNAADATILVARAEKPFGYGRIMRDNYSTVKQIVEEKDADDFQRDIKEINTGIICFDKRKLNQALKRVRRNKRNGEYYLTDCIGILHKKGALIESVRLRDRDEALGINSRADLARANSIMQRRINDGFMAKGVSIIDPRSTFIDYDVRIGGDSVIYPFTVIESNVKIGKRCHIGPFAHLRQKSVIGDDVVAGNFVELVRTKLSSKVLMKHFSYLGDARIEDGVNIGAGTVTANFDGKKKNLTRVKRDAFIGSDTVLVAPVEIGRGATTGAGSVVTKGKNVPDGKTVAGVPARPLK
ncbi:bifunctional N-acetylglucosamine-1-phosphate uridyltransferase/glucosamine-1-phosphate acetyltransferase [Candidatus Omnitrophota bacterium]